VDKLPIISIRGEKGERERGGGSEREKREDFDIPEPKRPLESFKYTAPLKSLSFLIILSLRVQ